LTWIKTPARTFYGPIAAHEFDRERLDLDQPLSACEPPCWQSIVNWEPKSMGTVKHILLACDGSEHAEHAAQFAASLARSCAARITLLTVHPEDLLLLNAMGPAVWPGSIPYASMDTDELRQSIEARATKTIIEPCLKICGGDLEIGAPVQVWGQPAEQICQWAEANEVDLVVMGSRGQSSFTRLLLGSVSTQVTNHAACPVAVVR